MKSLLYKLFYPETSSSNEIVKELTCPKSETKTMEQNEASACFIKNKFDFKESYENVSFHCVSDTDYYRKGNPYKIFTYPGSSEVFVSFTLDKADLEMLQSVDISLNHCSTSAEGVIDIFLNNDEFFHTFLAPKWNFGRQLFTFEKSFKEGINVIRILLSDGSPGVYWLSDATLSITKNYPRRLKSMAGQFISDNNIPYCEIDITGDLMIYLKNKMYTWEN